LRNLDLIVTEVEVDIARRRSRGSRSHHRTGRGGENGAWRPESKQEKSLDRLHSTPSVASAQMLTVAKRTPPVAETNDVNRALCRPTWNVSADVQE
jgi:hypothetical protein